MIKAIKTIKEITENLKLYKRMKEKQVSLKPFELIVEEILRNNGYIKENKK